GAGSSRVRGGGCRGSRRGCRGRGLRGLGSGRVGRRLPAGRSLRSRDGGVGCELHRRRRAAPLFGRAVAVAVPVPVAFAVPVAVAGILLRATAGVALGVLVGVVLGPGAVIGIFRIVGLLLVVLVLAVGALVSPPGDEAPEVQPGGRRQVRR